MCTIQNQHLHSFPIIHEYIKTDKNSSLLLHMHCGTLVSVRYDRLSTLQESRPYGKIRSFSCIALTNSECTEQVQILHKHLQVRRASTDLETRTSSYSFTNSSQNLNHRKLEHRMEQEFKQPYGTGRHMK